MSVRKLILAGAAKGSPGPGLESYFAIAGSEDPGLFTYRVEGGVLVPMPTVQQSLPYEEPVQEGAFSPSGEYLVAGAGGPNIRLFRLVEGGYQAVAVFPNAEDASLTSLSGVAWHPDGEHVTLHWQGGDIETYLVAGNTVTKVTALSTAPLGQVAAAHIRPLWTRDGRFLIAVSTTQSSANVLVAYPCIAGVVQPNSRYFIFNSVEPNRATVGPGDLMAFCCSVSLADRSAVHIMTLGESAFTSNPAPPNFGSGSGDGRERGLDVAFSPDGKYLAYTFYISGAGTVGLAVFEMDGGSVVAQRMIQYQSFTGAPVPAARLSWSDNGELLAVGWPYAKFFRQQDGAFTEAPEITLPGMGDYLRTGWLAFSPPSSI